MEFKIKFVCTDGHAIDIPSVEVGITLLKTIRWEMTQLGEFTIDTNDVCGDTISTRVSPTVCIDEETAAQVGRFNDANTIYVQCKRGALNAFATPVVRARRDKSDNIVSIEYGHAYNKGDILQAWRLLGCPTWM